MGIFRGGPPENLFSVTDISGIPARKRIEFETICFLESVFFFFQIRENWVYLVSE